MYLLIIFIPVLIYFFKDKSVVTFILSILVISLLGTLILDENLKIINIQDVFMLFLTATFLLLIILPWKKYRNINRIVINNEKKLNKLAKILIAINTLTFIILLVTTIIVQTTVENINIFKYGEGVSLEFYSTMLPFDSRYLTLATIIYGLSYFMLPLHFYYLSQNKFNLSIICFILSLNIILKGATYFSRYVIIEYIFLYIGMYLILRNIISKTTKRKLLKILTASLLILTLIFISLSIQRFGESLSYSIPSNSLIKNPVIYSYVDYLSQWYFNGSEILHDYKSIIFKGNITLSPIYELLSKYDLITYSASEYRNLRMQLWGNNWHTFTGFTAYSIYDYGIIGALFFCIFYFIIVYKGAPKNGSISINNLFLASLLIQLPFMSIFYSQMVNLILPLLYYIAISSYLKVRIK